MLFNSPEFLVFCFIVYVLYVLFPFRLQNYMLLSASYIFYGWWDTRFLFLVALSTTIDFWVGLMIENDRLTVRQWLPPALFLIGAAVVFLGFDPASLHSQPLRSGFSEFVSLRLIFWALPGVAIFVAVVTLVFRILARVQDQRRRLGYLMVSLVTQLGILGIFKYFNFFVQSLSAALNGIGIHAGSLHLNIVLPVGVSFYTFQSLSYTIDIYRRQFKPTDRFLDFALFVAYFPQLQAGPIERGRHLIPQLASARRITLDQTARGLFLIIVGFFKKIAIADGLAPIVDQIFGSSGRISWIDVIAGAVFFAIQIYCDFSGYTDIARGISKVLGIELIVNFNLPYFARNPQEFWRRWHISLSTWLRDYLYIPLGGNRGNLAFVCRNLMLTMLLGGLWHGAAWNFVLWGCYQGVLLCLYRIWQGDRPKVHAEASSGIRVALQTAATAGFFVVTCYGWLLFRAHSLAQIAHFSSLLVTDAGDLNYGGGAPRLSALLGMVLLAVMETGQHWTEDPHYYRRISAWAQGLLIASMITVTLMGMSNEPAQFIYFQF